MTFLHMLLNIALISRYTIQAINILPCTENVDNAVMAATREVLEDATPPGYTLDNYHPCVQTGRNPHRCTVVYQRNDNHYSSGCDYLTAVRQDFKRLCPQGSEISYVTFQNVPMNPRIEVQFLVNCYCTKNPRRHRSVKHYCRSTGYTREPASCTGT